MTHVDDDIVIAYRNARKAWLRDTQPVAEFIYRNARREFGCDLYYEVELPEHMRLVHPLGTVLGRATYGDYLVAYNNVSVGSDVDRNYPTLGEGVVLFGGARVLGNTRVGNNVWITANTVVQNVVVPDNVVVFPAVVTHKRERVVGDCDHQKASINSLDHQPYVTEDTYTSIGCTWRPTTRNVKKQFFDGMKK